MPARRPTLAALACQSTVQGHHPRQRTPPGPSPTLSQPPATALDELRAGASTPSSRARATGGRGGATTQQRPDHHDLTRRRGPAPRRNSRKYLGPTLQSPRLLRRVPPRARFLAEALLFLLLSQGVTTRPTAGSPAPPPSAARWPAITPQSSWTVGHCSIHVVTCLDFPFLTTIVSLPPKTEEGAGGPGAPVPRFLSRQGGPCDEATYGRLACR
jgi:hypothetical protein